jgi:hypothetical protein
MTLNTPCFPLGITPPRFRGVIPGLQKRFHY